MRYRERLYELLVPGCLVTITVSLWIVAGQFRGGVGRYEVLGPSFFPKLLLAGLGLVALLQIIRALGRERQEVDGGQITIHWRDLGTALGITGAYVAVLGYAGFLLSTLVFQALVLTLVFRYRRLGIVIGVPFGLTALYGAIFLKLMNVPLPRGRWLFAEFSRLFY